jgi:hypothetical protein
MARIKHYTERPWRVEPDVHGCKTIYGNVEGDGSGIFTATDLGYTHGQADEAEDVANAKLLAGAPAMYEALYAILDTPDHPMRKKLKDIARAVLAEVESPCVS